MNWMEILAALVNGVLVLMVVQALKVYGMPWLKTTVPWVLPLLAMVAGPLIGLLTNYLSGVIGLPIDLSAITNVLVGMSATVAFTVLQKPMALR